MYYACSYAKSDKVTLDGKLQMASLEDINLVRACFNGR